MVAIDNPLWLAAALAAMTPASALASDGVVVRRAPVVVVRPASGKNGTPRPRVPDVGAGLVAAAEVEVAIQPPPPPREARTEPAPPGAVWLPGYWAWGGVAYDWVVGRWAAPPSPEMIWVAPRWVQQGAWWVFHAGSWQAR